MGKPMTRNLLGAGYDVVVHNRSRAAVDELAGEGARPAEHPRAVAEEASVVITMLPDSPQVVEVMTGEHGLLEGVHEGSLVVDMSTISPVVTDGLAAAARERGAGYVDAPVSGGGVGAEQGTLSVMAGGGGGGGGPGGPGGWGVRGTGGA